MVPSIDIGTRQEPADIANIRERWAKVVGTNQAVVDVQQLLDRISELTRQMVALERQFQEVVNLSKESTCGIISLYERRLREFEQRLAEVYESQL